MKFSEYTYTRPDLEHIKTSFGELLKGFEAAATVEEQSEFMDKINALRSDFETQAQLVYIRHSIDTNDEFYKAENEFLDESQPVVQEYVTDFTVCS